MQKLLIIIALVGWQLSLPAQSDIDAILLQIEQNNQELSAYLAYMNRAQLDLRTENNLPDPQLGAYYLPIGNHATGDYSEFQISQSFEFPSVYSTRKNLIEQKLLQIEVEYSILRQDILSRAKQYCLQFIYKNQMHSIESERLNQSQIVFEQVRELFEKGQVGILEMNKAKVVWLQEQHKVRQIESELNNITIHLQNLNGGKSLDLSLNVYPDSRELPLKDSLWKDRLNSDPKLLKMEREKTVANWQLSLAKSKSLPDFSAGLNYQGVSGSNYTGVYAGLNIPLWQNRNKVKAAQLNIEYRELLRISEEMKLKVSFDKKYNNYQLLYTKFQEYQSTLGELNSEELLLQAYELGDLSFLEYYMEIQFYRQAYDAMQEMHFQLYKLKSELLNYQL